MVHTYGNPSSLHPTLKMTYKRAMKIERIARLTLDPSCYSNVQIANMLKVTPQTVVLIRQLPEFHAKITELKTGVLSSYDMDLRTNIENARREMQDMVPSAINVIKESLLGKYGNAIRYKAAESVFDREGSLAKVSKTSVSLEKIPNMTVDPEISANLLALLAAAPRREFTEAFTNSGATPTQAAFAVGSGATENDAEALLDSVDLDKKPN